MANVTLISVSDELCFGLRYIAANLKKHGHRANVIAFNVAFEFLNPIEDEIVHPEFGTGLRANEQEISLLVDLVRTLDTDVIGFTVSSTYYDTAALLTERLRDAGGYPIVWGGADVFFNPEDAIQYADAICMGDGEEAMIEIVERVARNGGLEGVKGIWFREPDGSVIKTERRPRIEDLDALPIPTWDLSDTYYVSEGRVWHQEYHRYGIIQPEVRFMVSSRGCPFHCTYCCNNSTGRQLYYGGPIFRRSVGNVIEEARQIRRQIKTVDHISFMDEVFTIGKEWLSEFSERWPKEVGIDFMALSHPNAIKVDTIGLLSAAGLRKITLGVQTGSERINRDVFGRRTPRSQILEAGRLMAENNVFYAVDLIHQNPYENEDDYRQTARLLNDFARPYMLGPVSPLQMWSNYDITKMALGDGMPIKKVNSHTYLSEKKPEYEFWRHLYHLVSLCPMDAQSLEFAMNARRYPGGEEFVKRVFEEVWSATYRSRNPLERINKDQLLEHLEDRLARLEGSRMVRHYFGLKDSFLRLIGAKNRTLSGR